MAEVTVKLMRGDSGSTWGFRLGGGKDLGYPLCVQRANPGSLAEQAGLRTGDQIVRIAGRPTDQMSHQDAQAAILSAGNYLDVTVFRGGSTTWQPSVQPVGDMRPGSQGPVTRTSLAANKGPQRAPIGSSHNVAAKPFKVGGLPLVNKQYNTPAALYSMENIRDTLEKHAEVLSGGAKGINFMKEEKPLNINSAVLQMVQEEDRAPKKSSVPARITAPPAPAPTSKRHAATSGVDSSPLHAAHHGLRHVEAPQAPAVPPAPTGGAPTAGGPNVCAECGKLIVGVFCRIKDRNMHAECFCCATCGNSLKNQGYFLVGGKLYCDMHARNASLMLKEPVSPSSSHPLPSAPSFPASSTSLPAFGAPSGGPHGFRSVPPPVPPKPGSQRNSGCFDAPSSPIPGPPPLPSMATAPPPPLFGSSVGGVGGGRPFGGPSGPASAPGGTGGRSGAAAPRRGRGLFNEACVGGRIPVCAACNTSIRGPFITAIGRSWCPAHFKCANGSCGRDLINCGFVEEKDQLYCENCFESYMAPTCSKCHQRIKGDCLNAMDRPWHPACFTCAHCRRPFGNDSFFLEDGLPYCKKDWNDLFTSKCFGCGFPIEAGDRWVEALNNNYHSTCFKCTVCHNPLEGQSFFAKAGKPFCRQHAR